MKKTRTKEKIPAKRKPQMKWQTGAYDRYAEFRFILPYPFLLLCRLMDITPEGLVRDFTDNLACGSFKREGRDEAKEHLINYFIEHGYGQHQYTEADIRRMFREMDAVGMLFPFGAKDKMMERYATWREEYLRYWFKHWINKPRRKLD